MFNKNSLLSQAVSVLVPLYLIVQCNKQFIQQSKIKNQKSSLNLKNNI